MEKQFVLNNSNIGDKDETGNSDTDGKNKANK